MIAALVVMACLVSGICIAAGGWGAISAVTSLAQDREDVTVVIDAFMHEMEQEDAEGAYALFSTRAQRQIPLSDLEELLEGNNYVLSEGYKCVTVSNISVSTAFNSKPNAPQGTVAEVSGPVTYAGGFTGRFTAVLEKEGDEWKLHHINITVPPDKFGSP